MVVVVDESTGASVVVVDSGARVVVVAIVPPLVAEERRFQSPHEHEGEGHDPDHNEGQYPPTVFWIFSLLISATKIAGKSRQSGRIGRFEL